MALFQAQTEPCSGLTHEHASCCHAQLVSYCLLQWLKFHTPGLLLSGWLLTNVQVNIIMTQHSTRHTCIYITLVLLLISSFYTSSIFLGRLAALHSLRHLHMHNKVRIDTVIKIGIYSSSGSISWSATRMAIVELKCPPPLYRECAERHVA
jgi:hypothetical protein